MSQVQHLSWRSPSPPRTVPALREPPRPLHLPFGISFAWPPGPLAHPCGRAGHALEEAGIDYELRQVKGGIGMPWTWPRRAKDRVEIERLTGQRAVPVLLPDEGPPVVGSGDIVAWAREQS